jgi:hypothetical protein
MQQCPFHCGGDRVQGCCRPLAVSGAGPTLRFAQQLAGHPFSIKVISAKDHQSIAHEQLISELGRRLDEDPSTSSSFRPVLIRMIR